MKHFLVGVNWRGRRGRLWAVVIAAIIKIIPRAEHGCEASDRLRMDDAIDRGGMFL
ncbi:MAG: hypothetical protein FWH17_10770 [Oscillospiraceae bacterium]|nr:hypothetical protein [Oscillospiraceae bacterium]